MSDTNPLVNRFPWTGTVKVSGSAGGGGATGIAAITGGFIDNTAITNGSLTDAVVTDCTITGGSLDGAPVGLANPASGTFTTLAVRLTSTFGNSFANYSTLVGANLSGSPTLATTGGDTNVPLLLTTKGTGEIRSNRATLGSLSSDLGTLSSLRSPYTAFWRNDNITYAGAMAARFRVTGALAGTITGSSFAVNEFTVGSDNTNATSAGGLSYFYVGASAGGSTFTGNRTAVTGKLNVTTATPNQLAFRFLTGGSFGAYTSVNPGVGYGYGYDETDGYIFGALLQARAETGARFVKSLQGLELNVGNYEADVPVLDFGGIQTVMENADVGPWMRQANAFGFANQPAWTGQGWGVGYAWVQANGQFGLNRTYGAVLGGVDTQYGTAPETAFGVDFFGLSLTQAHLRGHQNKVVIDGDGNVGGQVVAGTSLQTRSAILAKTSSVNTITVVDGSLFLTKPTLTVGAPPGGGTQATAQVNTMAAAYMRALTGGTGYAVNDTITLSGGTSTTAAVFTVAEVSGGVPKRLTITTPGSYTVLPSAPISTTTSGSGTGLTLSVWWTALTVTVTAAGDSYPQYPAPPVTAAYTLTGGDRSPLRRMEFEVAMTATQVQLQLNNGKINVTGIPTSSAGLSAGDVWSNAGILTVV